MVQDTRKDPRAKVLSMTVRYKSATVDEFIEHHSHDVSRGGMFIKTPSPFPPGTLLKFEVRIAGEQKVMQGVGRVVWKRDSTLDENRPGGMGVKFIKIDEDSRSMIDRLVDQRGGADGAFDAGATSTSKPPRPVSTPAPATATPLATGAAKTDAAKTGSAPAETPAYTGGKPGRKGTMIGLGAVKLPEASSKAPEPPPGAGFFPEGGPAEQPNPEDRTVMKQAAELLQEALRGAGGSMDEVMDKPASPDKSDQPGAAEPTTAPGDDEDDEKEQAASAKPSDAPAKEAQPSAKPAREPTVPLAAAAGDAARDKPRVPVEARVSERPASTAPASGGGGSAILMLLVVAAIGGGIYFFMQRSRPAEELPLPEPIPAATEEAPRPAEPAPIAPTPPPAVATTDSGAKQDAAASADDGAAASEAAKQEEKAAAEEAKRKAAEEARRAAAAAARLERLRRAREAAQQARETETETEPKETPEPAETAPAPKPPASSPKPPASAPTAAPTGDKPAPDKTPPAPAPEKTAPAPTPKPMPEDNPY